MFRILQKTIRTGVVTIDYPAMPARLPAGSRGKPVFDFQSWQDVRPAAEVCPTGAISLRDAGDSRTVTVDYGLCVFCGLCAEAEARGAVRITGEFELATRDRRRLVMAAEYGLNPDGTQGELRSAGNAGETACATTADRQVGQAFSLTGLLPQDVNKTTETSVEKAGEELRVRIDEVLGRSLAIRQVDAGSCNGCELEIGALNNPVYDIERFGIHFVASPRHADMLLVTGPVTRNMELALLKTYRATPEPRVVVAVGACGISGGIFGENYASLGGVDKVVPVDVYVPGCPPRPEALLHGILLAVGRVGLRHQTG